MNNDVNAAVEGLRFALAPDFVNGGDIEPDDLRLVLDALTDAEADAQELADKVRAVRLMFETAGLHRMAEDMDDVLDHHAARVSRRAAT